MNKSDIIYEITNRLDVTKKDTEEIVDMFLELIGDSLERDDKVVLSGFGTFEVRSRVSREGVNPRTGERIEIPGQKTVAFKIGKLLKDRIR